MKPAHVPEIETEEMKKKKEECIKLWVERNFSGVPTEWVQAVAEKKGLDIYAWPMWGTMWLVDDYIGEKLMEASVMMTTSDECENHDKDTNCDTCDTEEMAGAYNIKGTSAYIYDIDGQYVVGIHGAGWNFYQGVWDALYDICGTEWHKNS